MKMHKKPGRAKKRRLDRLGELRFVVVANRGRKLDQSVRPNRDAEHCIPSTGTDAPTLGIGIPHLLDAPAE
jgi:hypothetical protein